MKLLNAALFVLLVSTTSWSDALEEIPAPTQTQVQAIPQTYVTSPAGGAEWGADLRRYLEKFYGFEEKKNTLRGIKYEWHNGNSWEYLELAAKQPGSWQVWNLIPAWTVVDKKTTDGWPDRRFIFPADNTDIRRKYQPVTATVDVSLDFKSATTKEVRRLKVGRLKGWNRYTASFGWRERHGLLIELCSSTEFPCRLVFDQKGSLMAIESTDPRFPAKAISFSQAFTLASIDELVDEILDDEAYFGRVINHPSVQALIKSKFPSLNGLDPKACYKMAQDYPDTVKSALVKELTADPTLAKELEKLKTP